MMRLEWPMKMLVLAVCGLLTAGCSGSGNQPPAPAATEERPAPSATPGAGAGSNVSITFLSEPNPPEAGENAFQVRVTGPGGTPITDATVSAVFSMPAMPSMNMPAMRSAAALEHQADGVYRGTGQLSMGGTWNVAVTVSRGSEEIGSQRFSVIAK